MYLDSLKQFLHNQRDFIVATTTLVSTLLLFGSLFLAWSGRYHSIPKGIEFNQWPSIKRWQVGTLVFWSIVHPIAFWIDFYWLIDQSKLVTSTGQTTTSPVFELYKYGIDVSSKVWIALTSTLLVLYFGKDLKDS